MKVNDVNFLIIGAAKCATTWLQQQLRADPIVYMPDPELHFFSRKYEHGIEWYEAQFDVHNSEKLVGEKSNSYLSNPKAAGRIYNTLPDAKLIVQLRNPIERAYSDYCMLYRRGDVTEEIEKYLDPNVASDERFIRDGLYAPQIQNFLNLYDRKSLLILDFDTTAHQPQKQMDTLRKFLDLDTDFPLEISTAKVKDKSLSRISPNLRKRIGWLKPVVKPVRKSKVFQAAWSSLSNPPEYPKLSPKLRDALSEFYQPSIRQLETISGKSKSHWT